MGAYVHRFLQRRYISALSEWLCVLRLLLRSLALLRNLRLGFHFGCALFLFYSGLCGLALRDFRFGGGRGALGDVI